MVDTANGDAQLPVALTIREGGETYVVSFAGDRPFTIGRTGGCDAVLKTKEASRKHAEIVREGDQFFLIDNASTNGTRLNGKRVDRAELHSGDVIQIGKATIAFGESRSDARDLAAPVEEEITAAPEYVQAPPGEAAPPAAAFRRRASLSSYVFFAIFLGTIGIGAYYLKSLWSTDTGPSASREIVTRRPSPEGRKPSPTTEAVPAARTTSGRVPVGASSPQPKASSTVSPSTDLAPEVETALAHILPKASREKIGWDILRDLEELADTHSDARVARHAKQLHDLLEAVRSAEEQERTLDIDGALQNLVYGRRFGQAIALARLLANAAIEEQTSVFWKDRAARIERTAQEQFTEIDRRVAELVRSGKESHALHELVRVRDEFGGMAFYELLLDRLTERVLAPASNEVQRSSTSNPEQTESTKKTTGPQPAGSTLPWGQDETVVLRIVVTKKIEKTAGEDRVRWSRLARVLLSADPPFSVRPFGDSTATVDYVLRVDLTARVLSEHSFYDAIPISRKWEGRARLCVLSASLEREFYRLDGGPARESHSVQLRGGELILDTALDRLIARVRRVPGFRLAE